ncbi:MAG: M15 family metallopeptidase [Patescibacteria group bacterium]
MNPPIIDSSMTREEAILSNLSTDCPNSIIENQAVLNVVYLGFDSKLHQGQVVIDKTLASDISQIFDLALKIQFPFERVIPISQADFLWNDELSMSANNTSAFNYRVKTGKAELSMHARGRAIDINPRVNPYIHGAIVQPAGATYDSAKPGTLTMKHPIVQKFKELGWTWGGTWESLKDYQHFEKNIEG